MQTRLCGPSPQPVARLRQQQTGRSLTVTLPYGVRTFLAARKHRDCPVCLARALYVANSKPLVLRQ